MTERRRALDGQWYTADEFKTWYGMEKAWLKWSEAGEKSRDYVGKKKERERLRKKQLEERRRHIVDSGQVAASDAANNVTAAAAEPQLEVTSAEELKAQLQKALRRAKVMHVQAKTPNR